MTVFNWEWAQHPHEVFRYGSGHINDNLCLFSLDDSSSNAGLNVVGRRGSASEEEKMSKMVIVGGVEMTTAAADCVAEAGVSVQDDVEDLEEGRTTYRQLLRECLEGADADRHEGWREYVEALRAHLASERRWT